MMDFGVFGNFGLSVNEGVKHKNNMLTLIFQKAQLREL